MHRLIRVWSFYRAIVAVNLPSVKEFVWLLKVTVILTSLDAI